MTARGRVIKVTDEEGNTTEYFYDGNGNLVEQKDAAGHSFYFAYDARNRLTEVTLYSGETREGEEETGRQVTLYAYDALDRLVKVRDKDQSLETEYAYDSLGNCLRKKDSRGVTTYAYNEANQLIKSTSANGSISYTYDRRGNRVQETPQYDQENRRSYRYDGAGRLVSAIRGSSYNYDPEYRATEPYFTGYPYDGATNLYYAHNRFYDAQTGQWLSEDPVRHGLNWYSYCGSNPVSYVDPLGLAKAYVVYQPGMLESVGWSPEEKTKNIDYLRQGLIDNKQYKPDEVEVVAVNNKTEFINWWNKEMPDCVDTLILQMHGSPEALLFDLDGMKSSMKKDEKQYFDKK